MIYFLIPKTNLLTYTKLYFNDIHAEIILDTPSAMVPSNTLTDDYEKKSIFSNQHVLISNSLSYYLSNIKEKILFYEKEWDIFKKYTNPYEYIYTLIPNKKKCVSKNKPLSNSYFKMIEIVHIFKLMNDVPCLIEEQCNNPIKTFHLCEGNCGFIQAIVELRKNPKDKYIGMAILNNHDDNYDISSWKKSEAFLNENMNVEIETGKDGTGNILNIDNFIYCKTKYASSMDLVTGDGGFDISMDLYSRGFELGHSEGGVSLKMVGDIRPSKESNVLKGLNNQEMNISRLIFAQIAYALCLQKKGGSFVLKIFDCFMNSTIDLLYLLSSFYEKVYITKPQTSRYANSEKYVVCKNFLFSSCEDFYPFLLDIFRKMIEGCYNGNIPIRFLSVEISNHFLTKIEEFNSIFGQQQIENIYYTISLIETKNKAEKIDHLIKNNVQKCVGWCMKYGVGYNQITNANVFLAGV